MTGIERMAQRQEDEILRQITEMWSGAKAQLEQLRAQVQQAGELRSAGSELLEKKSERDAALQRLGEAFFKLVQSGEVTAPASLKRLIGEVKAKEDDVQKQQSDLAAILAEAESLAGASKAEAKKKPGKK